MAAAQPVQPALHRLHRTRLTLPQVRLLDDPQVAHRHCLSVVVAGNDAPDAVTLDVVRQHWTRAGATGECRHQSVSFECRDAPK